MYFFRCNLLELFIHCITLIVEPKRQTQMGQEMSCPEQTDGVGGAELGMPCRGQRRQREHQSWRDSGRAMCSPRSGMSPRNSARRAATRSRLWPPSSVFSFHREKEIWYYFALSRKWHSDLRGPCITRSS